MINCFEETTLKNEILPSDWQSQVSLDELEGFLQSNWEQRAVFYDDGEVTSRQQFLSFGSHRSIRTNNYIGTIVYKGQQMNVFPKVFRSGKNSNDTESLELSHLMKNLVCWIEYCTKIDYPFINIKTDFEDVTDLKELFISIYVRYVKDALDRGLFYRYEDKTDDLHTIKGKIDFKDYVCCKIPNGRADTFQCTYSNFEFDNLLNRIIKSTCKLIIANTSNSNQKLLRHILMKLNDVSDVRCKPSDCDKIRLSYLNGNYRIILSMSKMFLLNQTSTCDIDTNESFCFLFPTEYLFEGFIGGFMQSVLKGTADVKMQASELSLVDDVDFGGRSYGKAFTMRHDILVEHKEKGLFVFDTKYKMISRFSENLELKKSIVNDVSQNDLYQVREYALRRGLKKAYLLYPLFLKEALEDGNVTLKGSIIVEDKTHLVDVHLVRMPFIFEDDVEETKLKLTSVIEGLF